MEENMEAEQTSVSPEKFQEPRWVFYWIVLGNIENIWEMRF